MRLPGCRVVNLRWVCRWYVKYMCAFCPTVVSPLVFGEGKSWWNCNTYVIIGDGMFYCEAAAHPYDLVTAATCVASDSAGTFPFC